MPRWCTIGSWGMKQLYRKRLRKSPNGIRFINRDMLKYMALFLMVGGHLILYIGIGHFIDWMPKFFLR